MVVLTKIVCYKWTDVLFSQGFKGSQRLIKSSEFLLSNKFVDVQQSPFKQIDNRFLEKKDIPKKLHEDWKSYSVERALAALPGDTNLVHSHTAGKTPEHIR